MVLEIVPLDVGTLKDYPTPGISFQRGWGERHDVAVIMFAILGGEHPIIVDTATKDADAVRAEHGFDLVRSPEQEPLAALASIGVDPAEVRIVINTHLHWDHCSNNDLFPNADIYIQRAELGYAIAPVETNRIAFDNTRHLSPVWLDGLTRIVPVEGDRTIAEGVRLIHLPGHTPGSQGVLVHSGDTDFLLCGDFVDNHGNWNGDDKVSHIVSGSFTDLEAYWRSLHRVEDLGCEIIPSHDTAVLEHGPYRGSEG